MASLLRIDQSTIFQHTAAAVVTATAPARDSPTWRRQDPGQSWQRTCTGLEVRGTQLWTILCLVLPSSSRVLQHGFVFFKFYFLKLKCLVLSVGDEDDGDCEEEDGDEESRRDPGFPPLVVSKRLAVVVTNQYGRLQS